MNFKKTKNIFLAIVAGISLLAGTVAAAATAEFLPDARFKRTDGNWYMRSWMDSFGSAPKIVSPFANDQVKSFIPGQFYLLHNGELWTSNLEVVNRLWQVSAESGHWYKVHSNARDFFVASTMDPYGAASMLFVLTKDNRVDMGAKTGGYVDYIPGKSITHMVFSKDTLASGYERVHNMYFFDSEGVVYRSASQYADRPFVYDSTKPFAPYCNYFEDPCKMIEKPALTARMTAQGYTSWGQAIDRTQAPYIYMKTGEVYMVPWSAKYLTNELINLNTALALPNESFKQIATPYPQSILLAGQSVYALTADGRVYARGDNTYCQLGLAGCPESTSTTTWAVATDKVFAMSVGSNGSFFAKTDHKIYYSGPYNPYFPQFTGGPVPPSDLIGGNKVLVYPVGTLDGVPDAPKQVIATDGTINQNVQISWNHVVGAGTFNIYASDTKGVKGALVRKIPGHYQTSPAWCDVALLPPAMEGDPEPACDDSFYVSTAAKAIMDTFRDGRNLYFTVSASNAVGESITNMQDIGYPNLPLASSTVTIRGDFNGTGTATPVIVDPNQSDVHTIAITAQPDGAGTITIDPATNKMTFTAAMDWTGSKYFGYRVTDKGGYSVDAIGTVSVACPAPTLKSMKIDPYPAIASGTATVTYTLPSCSRNTSLNIQLFDGAQPMGILADASQPAFQNLPTGVDQKVTVPFSGLSPANYTAVTTMQDNVQSTNTQMSFNLNLLDTSKAYYELVSTSWSPRAFIDLMNVTIDSLGQKFCDLTVNEMEAKDSLYGDKPLKCLLEWTSLPEGLSQKANTTLPTLGGAPAKTGAQEIKFSVSVFRTNSEKVTFFTSGKKFTALNTPMPAIAVSAATDATTNMLTVPANGGIGAKLTIDSMGAGVSTTYAIDGYPPVTYDTLTGQSIRFLEFKPGALWSKKTLYVKSAYINAPTVFSEKTIELTVTPTDKMKLSLTTPSATLDNASIPVVASVGVPVAGNMLNYDRDLHGRWLVRIARILGDDTLQYLTEPVEMVGGKANITVPAENSMNIPKLVAVASVDSPIAGLSYEIRSDSRIVLINKGTPLDGTIVANKVTAPAPALVTFAAKMASKEDTIALGSVDFYLSTDDGATWRKESNAEESSTFRMSRSLGLGKFKVKAVFNNRFSGVTSESAITEVSTYRLPKLALDPSAVAYPGAPVTLSAVFTEPTTMPSGIAGHPVPETKLVQWEVPGMDAPINAMTAVLHSDEIKSIRVLVKARSSIAAPDDPVAWASQIVTVKFVAPTAPKVSVFGPPVVEVGKPHTFEARVSEPWAPARSDLVVRGEWTLPQGNKVSGTTLTWTPTDADLSPTGEKRPLTYTAWVEGYEHDGALASGSFFVKVWKYEWPTWDVKVLQDTTYAPSSVKLDVIIGNRKLLPQFRAEPLTITWNFPPDAILVKQKDGSAQLKLPVGKDYPVSVTMSDSRGNSTTVVKELLALDAPPFNIDLKLTPSNAMWREPVQVSTRPTVTGGHPFDRVATYTYRVNGMDVENKGGVARFQLENAGSHQVEVMMTSKMGATHSKSFPMVVVPNHPPSCDMTAKNAPLSKSIMITAICGDADGKIKGYRWVVNGEPVASSTNRATYLYSSPGGTVTAEVEVTDDSGATTTLSRSFDY